MERRDGVSLEAAGELERELSVGESAAKQKALVYRSAAVPQCERQVSALAD